MHTYNEQQYFEHQLNEAKSNFLDLEGIIYQINNSYFSKVNKVKVNEILHDYKEDLMERIEHLQNQLDECCSKQYN